MPSLLHYRFQCNSYTYYSKAKHKFKVCVAEHIRVYPYTGRTISLTKVLLHIIICFSVLFLWTFLFWLQILLTSEANYNKTFWYIIMDSILTKHLIQPLCYDSLKNYRIISLYWLLILFETVDKWILSSAIYLVMEVKLSYLKERTIHIVIQVASKTDLWIW